MRKKILLPLLGAAVLLCALMYFAVQKAGKAADPQPLPDLTVCVASDLHYIAPELTDNGEYFMNMIEAADGKAMQYSEEITDSFLAQVLAEKPDLLILSGDLTFNGAALSHQVLADKLQALDEAGIPVLVLPGNHDLNSTNAAAFHGADYTLVDGISGAEFDDLYSCYQYKGILARDSGSLSYVYEAAPGLRILMVDVNTEDWPGTLTDQTCHWVEKQLKAAKKAGASVLAVSHQNLLAHNSLFVDGYVMGNADRLEALYEEYGVVCNLSGHMHIQHIAQSDSGLTEIASSALPVWPCQYGVLEISSDGIDYHTEETLFDHADDARQLMHDCSVRSLKDSISNPSTPLCNFFAEMNIAYFAGRTDLLQWNEALYQQLRGQSAFIGLYAQSVYDDGFKDQTLAHIDPKE